jgi:hypothetical protein
MRLERRCIRAAASGDRVADAKGEQEVYERDFYALFVSRTGMARERRRGSLTSGLTTLSRRASGYANRK